MLQDWSWTWQILLILLICNLIKTSYLHKEILMLQIMILIHLCDNCSTVSSAGWNFSCVLCLNVLDTIEYNLLNWVMKLNLFTFFFCLFVSETNLKDCPFFLPILLTLCFRYLQKESWRCLSGQLFFKTPQKTLKLQENFKKNAFSSDLQT